MNRLLASRGSRMLILAVLAASAGGCGAESPNRSPNALDNPQLHAQAIQQEDRVKQENRKAEAEFNRRMRVKPVPVSGDETTSLTSTGH